MNIDQLRYFIDTVNQGCISYAAEKNLLTQSALSQAISGLETELGISLLIRTNHGVQLTALGSQVYSDACRIVELFDDKKREWQNLAELGKQISGEVGIIAFPSFCGQIIRRVIPTVAVDYPEIFIRLYEERTFANELELMEKYDTSICIGTCGTFLYDRIVSNMNKNNYEVDLLSENHPIHLYVSTKNKLARNEFVTEKDLNCLPFVFYSGEQDPPYLKYFDSQKIYRLHNRDAVMSFVAQNNAATVFSTVAGEKDDYIKSRQVVSIPIIAENQNDFPPANRYIIHKKASDLSDAERCILDILLRFFRKNSK